MDRSIVISSDPDEDLARCYHPANMTLMTLLISLHVEVLNRGLKSPDGECPITYTFFYTYIQASNPNNLAFSHACLDLLRLPLNLLSQSDHIPL